MDNNVNIAPDRQSDPQLPTTAVAVYQVSEAGDAHRVQSPTGVENYFRPRHSRLTAMAFNLLLPLMILVNIAAAALGYCLTSKGKILPNVFEWIASREASLELWIGATLFLVVFGGTLFMYIISLDYRRESRPTKRLYLLFVSFAVYVFAVLLGMWGAEPEQIWPFVLAGIVALAVPLAFPVFEELLGSALCTSAKAQLKQGAAESARKTARWSLRFRPADPDALQTFGLALAKSGRGAAALPYLLKNSGEIARKPPEVMEALVDVYDDAGHDTNALTALEAVYRIQPTPQIFERLITRWLRLERKQDVLRELNALAPKDKLKWNDTMRSLIFEIGDIERCRAFCREVELAEGPPFTRANKCYMQMLETFPQDLATHRALVDLGQRRGDADESAKLLEQLIQMDESNALEDRRKLISYYWSRGDRTGMLRHLNHIYDAGQATLDEKLRLVEESFTEGEYEAVQALVQEDADLRESTRALATLAHAYWEQQRLPDALGAIDQIREHSPGNQLPRPIAELEKNVRERLLRAEQDALREKLQNAPDDLALRFHYFAKLVQSGNEQDVVSELEQLLDAHPERAADVRRELRQLLNKHKDNRPLLQYLGDLHLRNGDATQAFELYEKMAEGSAEADRLLHESSERVLKTAPGFAPALRAEASWLARNNDPVLALEYISRYIAAGNQADSRLLNLEFECALRTEDLARAERVGKLLLPENTNEAAFLRRMAQIASDLQHFADAQQYLEQAQALQPTNDLYPRLLREVGDKQKRARIQELKNSIPAGNSNVDLHEELGDLYEQLGQLGEAMSEYQRVSHGAPDRLVARAKLALVFSRKGLHQEAAETLEDTDLRPDQPEHEQAELKRLFYDCAELMEQDGEADYALKLFRRVLRVEAGYRDVVTHVERLQKSEKRWVRP